MAERWVGNFCAFTKTFAVPAIIAGALFGLLPSSANAQAVADLTISKSAPATAAPNTDITYTITITNTGPDAASSATLTDPLPAGLTFVSLTPDPAWSCSPLAVGSGGTISCETSVFPSGSNATFTLVAHVPSGATPGDFITNVASVSSNDDPSDENNSASATTQVGGGTSADVAITKTGPENAAPGGNINYTLTVTNNGPDAAQSATWSDTLPGNLTFVNLVQSSGPTFTCTPLAVGSGGTVSCSIASLVAGSAATFTLTVNVPSGTPVFTEYSNTATVSSATADPNSENNSSTTTATVRNPTITTLTNTPNPSVAGQWVTFTATVTAPPEPGRPTGTVAFSEGTTTLATVPLDGTAKATFKTATLSPGSHTIVAVYSSADGSFSPSTSAPVTQVVNKANTATTLASSPNPSAFTQSVAFNATVMAFGGGAPAGNVNFKEGATTLGAAALDSVGTGRSVSAGASHTCAITEAGGVACWGKNDVGQLGNATTSPTPSPSPVAVVGLPRTIVAVAAGGFHTCALETPTGGVLCWGSNDEGEVGNGAAPGPEAAPKGVLSGATDIVAGEAHACALISDGTVKCWGRNTAGQLGDNSNINRFTPVAVTGLDGPATAIAAGQNHTCALMATGGVKCWGENARGQLGNGTLTPSNVPVDVLSSVGGPPLSGMAAIGVGDTHSCAVTTSGGIKCWGENFLGQLGDGTQAGDSGTARTTPVDVLASPSGPPISGMKTVDGGGNHTCALTTSGGAMCWGWNGAGQVGNGFGPGNFRVPQNVVGRISGTIGISAGALHTCAQLATDVVQCWGDNSTGQLGNGSTGGNSTTAVDVPDLSTLVLAKAAFNYAGLSGGAHTITAEYPGDTNHNASSGPTGQQVDKANTATALSSSPNPSTFGQAVTFTATVTSSVGTPTGTVTFTIDGVVVATVALSGNQATFTTSGLGGGNHTAAATYNGDVNFNTSTGALPGVQSVNKANSSTALTSAPNPSTFSQSVTFTATVNSSSGTPTGTVTFSIDGVTQSTVALSGGQAKFTTSALAVGNHTVTAAYNGDANFNPSTSSPLTQTVNKAATSTTLTASPNPSTPGQSVTFTATVTSGAGTPTGTVTFKDGAATLATVALVGNTAAFSTASLSPGQHSITATYSGDGNLAASTSSVVTQIVDLACADLFANATQISGANGAISGFNTNATGESGEPDHAGVSAPLNSVWCKWSAPANGPVSFDTTGSLFDTTLAAYTGNTVSTLTLVAANDNLSTSNNRSRIRFTAVQGATYFIAIDGAGGATGRYLLNWAQDAPNATTYAAVLPYARSTVTGTVTTALATILNAGTTTATQCGLAMPPGFPGTFSYQTTDANNNLSGTPNTPVDIPAGGGRMFMFAITPAVDLIEAEFAVLFACSNTPVTVTVPGVNTFLLSASAAPTPDLAAVSVTPTQDGIVNIPGNTGTSFFVAAAINVGTAGIITATADDNGKALPLTLTICETDLNSGACINPPAPTVSTTAAVPHNGTIYYTIFVKGSGNIPFDPANKRLFLRLRSADGITRGATNVAVRTAPATPPSSAPAARP